MIDTDFYSENKVICTFQSASGVQMKVFMVSFDGASEFIFHLAILIIKVEINFGWSWNVFICFVLGHH